MTWPRLDEAWRFRHGDKAQGTHETGSGRPFQHARRGLEKGDFKEALKDAKVCYRQTPSAEARSLLEQAYLGRCRQLHRAGLRAESQTAAENLLELGVTDQQVRRDLPELLIAVGLSRRLAELGAAGSSWEDASNPLCLAAADHAVLRPDAAAVACRPSAARLNRFAGRWRRWKPIGRRKHSRLLQDIPRGSPLADWKYFVRRSGGLLPAGCGR